MPIFEYECPNGHRREIIDLKNERLPSVLCEQCDLHAVLVPSASSFQWGAGPKESGISKAIQRVKKAGL